MTAAVAGVAPGDRARATLVQVGDLLRLKWSMLSGRGRLVVLPALVVAALVPVVTFAVAVSRAAMLPADYQLQASELSAGTLLVVAVGIVVSALAAAGGRELIPRQQLWAYPVSPAAEHLSILLMSPANLAWWLQSLGLFVVMGTATWFEYSTSGASSALLLAGALVWAVSAAWILALTALSQVLAWVVEIVKTLPGGRWGVRLSLALLVVIAVRSANSTTLTKVLGWAPVRALTDWTFTATNGQYLPAVLILMSLLAVAALATLAGGAVYAVLLRRPTIDQSRTETRLYRPRPLADVDTAFSDVRVWRRQEWAMVLRSVPLRRGLLVLVIVPVAGGLLARVGVNDVALLTGVVASGAGLLFGVNAFSLDAEGAVWRENLPVPAQIWILARTWVLAEMILGTAALTTAAALTSATGRFSLTAVVVVLVGVPTMAGQVIARCLHWSVTRPERAELRTARDSPASPGRMVGYSARLVGATLWMGIVLAICARFGQPWLPVLVVIPSLTLTALSVRRSIRRFCDHEVRARLVQAVSRG